VARIALREYWPDSASGEKETLGRIERALKNLGHEVVRVRAGGPDESSLLDEQKPLFLLDIHFAIPTPRNVFSVGALWNPIEYYTYWGGSQSLEIQVQHDMFVAANRELAARQLHILRPDLKHPILPLNHSVSKDSLLDPIPLASPSIFYSGIGWDRSSLEGHRNEQVLRFFEKKSMLQLFGPEKLADGTRPWADFKTSYQGEIPFDSFSIFKEINSCAFYLSLSSESHRRNHISSNRLFEAIAGGALPIVDSDINHSFNESNVVTLDRSIPIDDALTKLHADLMGIIAEPHERVRRVKELQAELMDSYTFESQLEALVDYVANLGVDGLAGRSKEAVSGTVASIFDLTAGHQQSGLLVGDPIHISMSLLDHPELAKLKYLKFSEADSFAQIDKYSDWMSGDPDVVHIPGQWETNGESHFLGVDAVAPGLRIADTLIVRSELVGLWISESAGAASVGSLLLACVEDSRSRDPLLRHHFVDDFAFNLRGSKPPRNLFSLVSNLDPLALVKLSRSNKTIIGDLAALARSARQQALMPESTSLLPRLFDEVKMLGLSRLIRLTASKVVSLVFRRS
jgi:hypothetical protein